MVYREDKNLWGVGMEWEDNMNHNNQGRYVESCKEKKKRRNYELVQPTVQPLVTQTCLCSIKISTFTKVSTLVHNNI